MAKKKKSGGGGRRRGQGAPGFKPEVAAGIGVGVARYGGKALGAMPHNYDSYDKGKGKGPLSGKRVQILGGVTLYCVLSKNKKIKRWAPFAGFLFGLSVAQHKSTYAESIEPSDFPIEVYPDEIAAQVKDYENKAAKAAAAMKKK